MEREGPIRTDPRIMLGKPTVAGTRITVDLILARLAAGESPWQVHESYPRLSEEGLQGALRFAWEFVQDIPRLFLERGRRFGRLREEWTLRDAVEVLTDGTLARESSLGVPGETDGGFLGDVTRMVEPAGISKARVFDVLRSLTVREAGHILEELAFGAWDEHLLRRRRGTDEVLVVLAFASVAIRVAYLPRRRASL